MLRINSKKLSASNEDSVYQMKLVSGPKALRYRSLFHSKRMNVTFSDNHVQFSFGSGSNVMSLLYTELISWSVYRQGGNGDIHFIYQKLGVGQRTKKMILRTRNKDILEGFLNCLDAHIAELMVHKGMATSTNEALCMFERFSVGDPEIDFNGREINNNGNQYATTA